MRPVAVVWAAAAAFAACFGTLAVLRHRAFASGRFDLGNMTQAVWSTANGDVLSVTRRARKADLAARLPLRPDLDPVRPAVVALARPRAASRRPSRGGRDGSAARLLARSEAPRRRVAGGRAGAGVLALGAGAVADGERLPPGRARLPATALRVVAPRRGEAVGVCAARRGCDRHEGARRPGCGCDGPLVRGAAPVTEARCRNRRRRRHGSTRRRAGRRATFRCRRLLGVRKPLRRSGARGQGFRLPRRAAASARAAAAWRAARRARCCARAGAEHAFDLRGADVGVDPLRRRRDARTLCSSDLRRRATRPPAGIRGGSGITHRNACAGARQPHGRTVGRARRSCTPGGCTHPGRGAGQRDERTGRASLVTPADLQLSRPRGGRVGGRRRAAADAFSTA